MWDITKLFKGELPLDFRLMEDEGFVYLYYKETLVGVFSVSTNAEAISKAAEDYLRQKIEH